MTTSPATSYQSEQNLVVAASIPDRGSSIWMTTDNDWTKRINDEHWVAERVVLSESYRAMSNMPRQRDVEVRVRNGNGGWSNPLELQINHESHASAILGYQVGDVRTACSNKCGRGYGKFPKCITVPGSLSGACVSCHYSKEGADCEYYEKKVKDATTAITSTKRKTSSINMLLDNNQTDMLATNDQSSTDIPLSPSHRSLVSTTGATSRVTDLTIPSSKKLRYDIIATSESNNQTENHPLPNYGSITPTTTDIDRVSVTPYFPSNIPYRAPAVSHHSNAPSMTRPEDVFIRPTTIPSINSLIANQSPPRSAVTSPDDCLPSAQVYPPATTQQLARGELIPRQFVRDVVKQIVREEVESNLKELVQEKRNSFLTDLVQEELRSLIREHARPDEKETKAKRQSGT